MRRFKLVRTADKTGVSGTGVVGEGIVFCDGQCVLKWISGIPSITIYPSVTAIIAVHGHGKSTVVEYLDPDDCDQDPSLHFPFKEV